MQEGHLKVLEVLSELVVCRDPDLHFFAFIDFARISRIFHNRNVRWMYLGKQIQMVFYITISHQRSTNAFITII